MKSYLLDKEKRLINISAQIGKITTLQKNPIVGYAIVVDSVLLIYTISFYPGLRKDWFNIFMGGGVNPLLKHISFKEINGFSLKEDNNNLKLIIKAYGSTYIQTYAMENKDMIVSNLKHKKIEQEFIIWE